MHLSSYRRADIHACVFLSLRCVFGLLVIGTISGNHASLLLMKEFRHSCVCVLLSCLCVCASCDGEGFGITCTSPHKCVRIFMCVFLCLACAFGCLVMGKVSGNHALVLLIKAFRLLCLVACKPASRAFVRLVTRG